MYRIIKQVILLSLILVITCSCVSKYCPVDSSEKVALFFEKDEVTIAVTDSGLGVLSIAADVVDSHHAFVVREELEHTARERADYRVQTRHLTPDGDVRAVAALQRLIMENRESKNNNRNLLELADFYAELAEDYVEANPPESLSFDPPTFEELVNNAARLYEAVANQDGATERIEASRQLEAFLAFTLRVDHDRFSR